MRATDSHVRRIIDAQQGIHKNLATLVRKHQQHPSRKPISQHTQQVFDEIRPQVEAHLAEAKPLIFDSGCGTAMSTRIIANQNPDALVIGIDRSAVRLAKQSQEKQKSDELSFENKRLVRAECADFWALALKAGWCLDQHFILYPNPYPKSKHLKRRWHGHPAFPHLLALGGTLQLRSNWPVYVEEFCHAANLLIPEVCQGVEIFQPKQALTLFEKKYQQDGQKLYRCRLTL